jgi:Tol biopolymer transport system component
MAARRHRPRPGLREVWVVWGLYGLAASAIFATYSRLPVAELYHVSHGGPSGGAGRVLVFLNFSTALASIAIVAVLASVARRRTASIIGLAAVVLCAAVFWPGVVDQNDLDARWVNAIAAAGVLLALALTVAVTIMEGIGSSTRVTGDRARVLAAVVLFVLALPWLAAEAGFLIGRWPGFGSVYYSDEWYASFGHARLHPAVHPGHHHGLDGALLTVTAIMLSRTLGRIEAPLRTFLGGYLALLSVYGLANLANDFWFEQLVKRGVTSWQVPSMLVPSASIPWLILLALALLAYALFFRYQAPAETIERRRRLWPVPWTAAVVTLVVVGLLHGDPHGAHTPIGSVAGIAFASAPSGTAHIYVTTRAGVVQLTHDDGTDLAPKWSRNGGLVFQSNRDGNWELYSMMPPYGLPRRLTHDDAPDGEPALSPDALRIAFTRSGDLYAMRSIGRGAHKILDNADWPSWSADGALIAYQSRSGGRLRIVAKGNNGDELGFSGNAQLAYPAWSPTGRRLACECLVHSHWHICLIDLRARSQRVLTRGDSDEFAPAWSPDGKRIAFIGDRDGNDQLYVMRADGTRVVRLTSGQAEKDTPAWRP